MTKKKIAEENLTKVFVMRTTPSEFKDMQKFAKAESRSVGEFMRWLFLVWRATGKKFTKEQTYYRGV